MSWMSLLLWMLSSLLGVCVCVVPADSWEGKNPRFWALCVVLKDPNQPKSGLPGGLGTHPQGWSNELGATVGHPHRVSHHFCPCKMLMQLPQQEFVHALQVHASLPGGVDAAGKGQAPPSWMVPEGRTWPCLRVSSGPTQQLWVWEESGAGDAAADEYCSDWMHNRMLLVSFPQKMVHNVCFLPNTTAPVLSPPSAFFFLSYFILDLWGTSGYLPNICWIKTMICLWFFILICWLNFCLDSGTYFFNLLRIAVPFSDVFATIALWLWNEVQRTLVGRR